MKQHFNSKDTHVFYRINKNNRSANKLKNLVSLWKINKLHNQLSFFANLKSIFFISLNSLKKNMGGNEKDLFKRKTKIYVMAPSKSFTGGPELLHQIALSIKKKISTKHIYVLFA